MSSLKDRKHVIEQSITKDQNLRDNGSTDPVLEHRIKINLGRLNNVNNIIHRDNERSCKQSKTSLQPGKFNTEVFIHNLNSSFLNNEDFKYYYTKNNQSRLLNEPNIPIDLTPLEVDEGQLTSENLKFMKTARKYMVDLLNKMNATLIYYNNNEVERHFYKNLENHLFKIEMTNEDLSIISKSNTIEHCNTLPDIMQYTTTETPNPDVMQSTTPEPSKKCLNIELLDENLEMIFKNNKKFYCCKGT